jgi:hypothetical protein
VVVASESPCERGGGWPQRRGHDVFGDGIGLQGDAGRHQDALHAADLMLTLTTAHTQKLKAVIHRAIKAYRPPIIDEIGYVPMDREQANLFFQGIAACTDAAA